MEYVPNFTDSLTLFTSLNTSSSSQSFAESSGYTVVRKMQTIFVPIIFSFGLLGNLLALGCFLSQPLRTASCCLYMAAKCLSDTAFLAVLFIMWLYRVHVDLLNVQGVCQLTIFVSYVSGFTSVWLVLAVTYENYIRICRPYMSKTYCTRRVALIVIGVIVVIAAIFYSFALWTNTVLGGEQGEQHVVGERVGVGEDLGKADSVEQEEEKEEAEEEAVKEDPPLCMAMVKFKDILMAMTFVDTVMTLVLPSLLIVPLVLMTLVAVARAFDRKNRLQDSLLSKRSPRDFKNSMEAKVARFLLAVSLTFMLLHTPGHLIRLKLLVGQYILHEDVSDLDATLQRLFETLYYFNFCCSIVIFLASGANFRSLFLAMYCGRFVDCKLSPPSPSLSSSTATTMTTDEATMMKMGRRRRRGTCEDSVTTLEENGSFRTILSSLP